MARVVPEPEDRVLTDPFFASAINGVNAALRDTHLPGVAMARTFGEMLIDLLSGKKVAQVRAVFAPELVIRLSTQQPGSLARRGRCPTSTATGCAGGAAARGVLMCVTLA